MKKSVSEPCEVANLKDVYLKIKACEKETKLKAGADVFIVTKTRTEQQISPLLQFGHLFYSENRVNEAQDKWGALRANFANLNIKLSMVGHLQTNKVQDALDVFNCIESIDSVKLVEKIANETQKRQCLAGDFFVQVNTGNEPQKNGVSVKGLRNILKAFAQSELTFCGLMCIPPVNEPAHLHFALLRNIAKVVSGLCEGQTEMPQGLFKTGIFLEEDISWLPNLKLQSPALQLSMGMSNSFIPAALCGATRIRVGTKIFS